MNQRNAIQSLYSGMGIGQKKKRSSPSAKRMEIAKAKIESLEIVLKAIQDKARETPAWAAAYFSSATAVEFEIARIKSEL